MKYSTFTMLLAVLLLYVAAACKKEKEPPEPATRAWGEAFSSRNGDDWAGLCRTRLNNANQTFSLVFTQSNAPDFHEELVFLNLPYQTGTHFPFQGDNGDISALTCSAYTTKGDLAGNAYRMLKDSAVILSIDSIDYNTGVILGKFSGAFVKAVIDIDFDPGSPDTLIYKDGYYRARVID